MGYYPHAIESIIKLIKEKYPGVESKKVLKDLPSYLLWMLGQIKKNENDFGKASRWIGYVIGRTEGLKLLVNKNSRDIIRVDVENMCKHEDHSEYNGHFCLCWGCRHDDYYCTEAPCGVCDGPVVECNYNGD